MDQRIIDLYDDYVHHHFDRRLFLERAGKLVGIAGAATAFSLLKSNFAAAATVAEDDPAITTQRVTFPGAGSEMKAYLAEPKSGPAKRGSIVVIHQNRGLNKHIEDVARRLAKEGYNALAVDFLSPLGGTPADEMVGAEMISKLDRPQRNANTVAASTWLRDRPQSNGKTGGVGFCWGGGAVNQMAVLDPKLTAAVVFYGAPPSAEETAKIQASMLLNYADPALDTNLGERLPAYEAALKANNKKYTLYIYPGANHSFHDDTGARYNETAAKLAWSRTLTHFKTHLS